VNTSLEELLSTTLRANASDAPQANALLDNVRRGVARRRRNHVVAVSLLAAASVVAVIMAVAVAVSAGGHHATNPVSPPPIVATTTTAPSPTITTAPRLTTTAPTVPAGVSLRSVNWSAVTYPITNTCRPDGVVVQQVAYPDPTPDVHLAVVLVRCNAGAGNPSSILYVYDRASSPGSPHLASTLVYYHDNWGATAFSANGADLRMRVDGYSSDSVPRCCPDVHTTLVWRWTPSGETLVSTVPPHVGFSGVGAL
jgi:hypothetical protein